MSGKPDSECDECKGSGTYRSTYNPKSKWDWYAIGGRWTGMLSGNDPADDPDNWEACFLCLGTPGFRNDPLGQAERQKNPGYGCNSCHTGRKGEKPGLTMKWRLKADSGDIAKVSSFLRDGALPKDKLPFAILEPDGTWSERGDMGWWGMVRDEKPAAEWHDAASAILARHQGCLAVVVDVHHLRVNPEGGDSRPRHRCPGVWSTHPQIYCRSYGHLGWRPFPHLDKDAPIASG